MPKLSKKLKSASVFGELIRPSKGSGNDLINFFFFVFLDRGITYVLMESQLLHTP